MQRRSCRKTRLGEVESMLKSKLYNWADDGAKSLKRLEVLYGRESAAEFVTRDGTSSEPENVLFLTLQHCFERND